RRETQPLLFEQGPDAVRRVGRKDRGGGSLSGAASDEASVGAAAGGQAKRVEDDGLAGAGLAGETGQAGAEPEVEAPDERDVADAEADQHGPSLAENRAVLKAEHAVNKAALLRRRGLRRLARLGWLRVALAGRRFGGLGLGRRRQGRALVVVAE